uniref:Ion-translocating oxidoreductase complex subunit G n=1 Tax=uncultured bacterium Contig1549a TaxID=1393453 RepID=W0FK11_9BACT|nr:NADH:ubiquinone oxidoreductase, Na(+)-translocating, B subunit [uncultured bacterium Contig1549a]
MRVVLLSLMPATCVGIISYGWQAFAIVALAVISAVLTEWVFNKIVHKPNTIWDGSAAVTGLLLALSLGPRTPLYLPVIGSVFAIAVVKGCFGGLGKNFINPALAARCFLLISFANAMSISPILDATSSATPMGVLRMNGTVDITRMFLGTADGVIGSSILALLIGGLVLWSMDIIHGQICFSVLGGFTLFIALFGGQGFDIKFLLAHLCGGGVVMGAFFMATDYVTSPVSRLGQFIYGCLIGVLGGVFRLYGNTADSFSYAIIIGNVCTPLIDTYIVQKPLAYRKIGKTRPVKREPFRIPKPVIALTLIAAIAGVALSGVYSMTKGTIDLQELQKKTAAYKEVCPEAEIFELVDAAEELIAKQDEKASPKINEFYVGKTADGQVAGYAASVTAKGFGGDVTMALGLTPDGAVRKIAFTELNETAGLGMEADKALFKDQFAGRSGELSLIKGTASGEQEISALTGATVTSTAVVNGVNAGLAFCDEATKGGN